MGLVDALRQLFNFHSLTKIKRAIDGLSYEEWNQLLEYMENQLSDVQTADPEPADPEHWIDPEEWTWY